MVRIGVNGLGGIGRCVLRHVALVDGPSTRVLRDRQVKVIAWYDNEMGYAARLVDLAAEIGGK